MPLALGDQRARVVDVAQQRQRAVEVRAATFVGQAAERGQQLVDIARGIAWLTGIARGIQTGCAVERVDTQARVIGQRRQPGHPRCVTRLQQRVLDKGQAGFLDVLDPEFALCHEFDTGVAKQAIELGKFSGIAAGENDTGHGRSLYVGHRLPNWLYRPAILRGSRSLLEAA